MLPVKPFEDSLYLLAAEENPAVVYLVETVQQTRFRDLLPAVFEVLLQHLPDGQRRQADEDMRPDLVVRPMVLRADSEMARVLRCVEDPVLYAFLPRVLVQDVQHAPVLVVGADQLLAIVFPYVRFLVRLVNVQ